LSEKLWLKADSGIGIRVVNQEWLINRIIMRLIAARKSLFAGGLRPRFQMDVDAERKELEVILRWALPRQI
jgi:hypothetical protein